MPGLLQRLEFCDALASLVLLGYKLLLLGRELIELLLRGGELLLLGGKFLHAMMQGADVVRQLFQLPAHIKAKQLARVRPGLAQAAAATSSDLR